MGHDIPLMSRLNPAATLERKAQYREVFEKTGTTSGKWIQINVDGIGQCWIDGDNVMQ